MTEHQDFGGLQQDLQMTGAALPRRDLIRMTIGAGAMALFGVSASSLRGSDRQGCTRIPQETPGPFPGDGSNGPDVLKLTGVVRRDIRPSFAGLSGMAAGVPLTVSLTLVSAQTCKPLAGHAVYLWHCDGAGLYSLYSPGATDQNYCRGVQEADAKGTVTFTTIFPACYAGRWPHAHFEVYPSLAKATDVRNRMATSQLALPAAISDEVYATPGYEVSVRNFKGMSLATDNVFRDGAVLEIATMSGMVAKALTATLTVAV